VLETAVQPDCLKGLTDVEEMLIARVKSIMHVRYTSGHQLSYKNHIVNLPQNIKDVANRLPRLPCDLDLRIICRQGEDLPEHVDYNCQRQVVHEALVYKIANDPNHADLLHPDEDALQCLPVEGSVAHLIPGCAQQEQLAAGGSSSRAPVSSGPTEAVNGIMDVDEECGIDEECVAGVLNVSSSCLSETEHVCSGVQQVLQHHGYIGENVINAPPVNPVHPVNEHSSEYLSMAFPTLFPDGSADFNQPHLHKVHLGDYFKHLLRYHDGRFARH
jgi:ATP-dependent DNA helicase PIF1